MLIGSKTTSHRSIFYAWTVDEPEDLEMIRDVVAHFKGNSDFTWEQVLELTQQQPHLFHANAILLGMKEHRWGTGRSSGAVQNE